jgi:hypothetical protein
VKFVTSVKKGPRVEITKSYNETGPMQGQTRGEKNKPITIKPIAIKLTTNFTLSQAANKTAGWLK